MCSNPKREVDLKITYQGISLGYIHLECMKQVIAFDSTNHMRDEMGYTIWSLAKQDISGHKIRHSEPCLNSFHQDPPEEVGA